jgi:hypothetical protein
MRISMQIVIRADVETLRSVNQLRAFDRSPEHFTRFDMIKIQKYEMRAGKKMAYLTSNHTVVSGG